MPTKVTQGVLVVTPVAPISRLDFRWRLTLAEQVVIKRAETEHPDPDVRATLAILRESLQEVTDAAGVAVDDRRTAEGAAYVVQVLVAAGLVAPEDAPARLAAMLAPR